MDHNGTLQVKETFRHAYYENQLRFYHRLLNAHIVQTV
jgi:hypothetical protein